MAKNDGDKPGLGRSLVMGILFTLVLLIIVPAVCGHFLSKYVVDIVGDTELLNMSSAVLVNLVMWLIIIGFTFALGGGRILKKYGVVGIVGLLVAYYLLDDLKGGIFAVITLIVVSVLIYLIKKKLKKT
ncbi:MAG: hypothetical protein LBS92_04185 [Candidatus Methanoplasma sp.]|jgi:hypothetical protein|nr:hypothetical protein [Candidatus Methanoplasma sp.]